MLKVGIIGPESTGKSTLAQQLAQCYQGVYVPEYSREYVEKLGHPYTYDDVCAIARHQIKQLQAYAEKAQKNSTEDEGCVGDTQEKWEALAKDGIVFFDTELIITRVWFDYCYGSTPDWVLEAMEEYKMDVYLLLYPDIAWVDDPVRENGGEAIRLELFHRYEQEIRALAVPYYIIRHTSDGRISATQMA